VPFDARQSEWRQLRRLMWHAMGPVRGALELRRALSELNRLTADLPPQQLILRQRLTLAAAMIGAALRREESRGAHWRSDFSQRNRQIDGERALFSPAA
jgi:L-aspartate oxidase